MSTLFTLVFLIGCVGIWYFIKKVPNKKNRNISIAVAIISLFMMLILSPSSSTDTNTKEATKNEPKQTSVASSSTKDKTTTSSSTAESSKEKTKIELLLEIPAEIEAGSDSKASITGKTNPGARVSVGAGIIGDSTEADSNGNFSLDYEISGNQNKELSIYTSLDGDSKSSKITVKPNAQVVAAAAQQKAADEAAKQQEKEQKEKEASLPTEYKSALNKAKSYSQNMHMSKAGIYDQLTSEYGEKFTPEAAQYAVDNLKADYNANALAKAKTYQEQMSMSPEAVRDQLTSEHGERFTPEEADYAVQNLNK